MCAAARIVVSIHINQRSFVGVTIRCDVEALPQITVLQYQLDRSQAITASSWPREQDEARSSLPSVFRRGLNPFHRFMETGSGG